MATVDRDADVHQHGTPLQSQRRRDAVSVAVLGHVHFADTRDLHGRHAEQAECDFDDCVQEDLEHDINVGRCRGFGRARLPGEHYDDHRAVRIHRSHRMYIERRAQHQSLGPVAKLCRTADGHH